MVMVGAGGGVVELEESSGVSEEGLVEEADGAGLAARGEGRTGAVVIREGVGTKEISETVEVLGMHPEVGWSCLLVDKDLGGLPIKGGLSHRFLPLRPVLV